MKYYVLFEAPDALSADVLRQRGREYGIEASIHDSPVSLLWHVLKQATGMSPTEVRALFEELESRG
jgi:hypothetical protein